MRAFLVAWRAIVTAYNELFLLVVVSLLWWATGGLSAVLAGLAWWLLASTNGPFYLAPLLAIPIGPASAALAVVARRAARDQRVDRSFFFDGLRTHWKQGLAISAIGMVGLSLLLLNVLFYSAQSQSLIRILAAFWLYLVLFWLSAQFYVFPVLVGLGKPTVLRAIKTAALGSVANPLFSALLLVVAAVLSAVSIAIVILVVLLWPALMALLGEHSLRLFFQRAGVPIDGESAGQ